LSGPEPRNLAEAFERAALAHPDRIAVIGPGGILTLAEVRAGAIRVARRLAAAGVQPGEAVALLFNSAVAYHVALQGTLRAGAVVVTVNPMLRQEAEALLRNAGARVILAERAVADELAPRLPGFRVLLWEEAGGQDAGGQGAGRERPLGLAGPDDVAVVSYTSGTTGEPKGAEHTHRAFTHTYEAMPHWADGLSEGSVLLCALPFFASYSTYLHAVTPLAGTTLVSCGRYDAAWALEALERHRVTHAIFAPAMLEYLLALPDVAGRDLGALAWVCSSGAPPGPGLEERVAAALGARVCNGYGSAEAGQVAVTPVDAPRRPGSVGPPLPGVEVQIRSEGAVLDPGQVGDVWARTPWLMRGYRGRPEATAAVLQGGWLRLPDLGHLDRDGFLYIVDRADAIINRAGFKVAPAEVERALARHPGVLEVAVLGRPDAVKGRLIDAYVVARPGAAPLTGEELRAFCRQHLAAYKVPDRIELVATLPRTASGKVLRRPDLIPRPAPPASRPPPSPRVRPAAGRPPDRGARPAR
jgi:long-chain acyl-CoA synthetase